MMQVQMPKFVKISSNFICIYEKALAITALPGPSSNCCLSLYLNIAVSTASLYSGIARVRFWRPGVISENTTTTTAYRVNLGQRVHLVIASSTCSRSEPLRISGGTGIF